MKTITFYSYKGGVGRTLLMVNMARYLSAFGKKVVMMDCDFEAPGLHYKFEKEIVDQVKQGRGLVDIFYECWYEEDENGEAKVPASIKEYCIKVMEHPESGGEVYMLPAGKSEDSQSNTNYWKRLRKLNWQDMFYSENRIGLKLFQYIKKRIEEEFEADCLLIDARTGITEVGGVVVAMLPDVLVSVFINNEENIAGTRHLLRAVGRTLRQMKRQMKVSLDTIDIEFLPVLSRVPVQTQEEEEEQERKILSQLNAPAYELIDTLNLKKLFLLHVEPELALSEPVFLEAGSGASIPIPTDHLYWDYLTFVYKLFPELVEESQDKLPPDLSRESWSDEQHIHYAVILRRKLWGESEATAQALNRLGIYLYFQKRYAEAEPVFKETLEIAKNALGEAHPKTQRYSDNYNYFKERMAAATY